MQTRLKDVAQALGLSISTVNAALRNRKDISEATRERVFKKAKELNYRPNWVARSLKMQKTQVLGVVVPDLSRSFFTEVMKGIELFLRGTGYHLVVCSTGEDPAKEDDEIAAFISKQVDGLIVASANAPEEKKVWQGMVKSGVPLVLVDRYFEGVPFVGGDDERIGLIATRHLMQQGYRRIAHLREPNISTAIGRYRGYLRAMHEAKMRVRQDYIVSAEYHNEESGYEGIKQLLALNPRPDAVFAASDPIAIGAMQALQESGLRLPTDFGVIGVGMHRYGEYLRIPLSTVDQHRTEIGRLAASILLGAIDGKPVPTSPVLIEPTLIVRDSSCRIPELDKGPTRSRGTGDGARYRSL